MLPISVHPSRVEADEGSGEFIEEADAGGEVTVAHADDVAGDQIGLLLTVLGLQLKRRLSTWSSRVKQMNWTMPLRRPVAPAELMAWLSAEPWSRVTPLGKDRPLKYNWANVWKNLAPVTRQRLREWDHTAASQHLDRGADGPGATQARSAAAGGEAQTDSSGVR